MPTRHATKPLGALPAVGFTLLIDAMTVPSVGVGRRVSVDVYEVPVDIGPE